MTRRDPEITREEDETAMLLAAVWRITRGDDPLPDMTPAPIIAAGLMSAIFGQRRKAYGGEIYEVTLSSDAARRVLIRYHLTLDQARERLLDILVQEEVAP